MVPPDRAALILASASTTLRTLTSDPRHGEAHADSFGIASDPDDDGNGASQQVKNNQQPKNTQQPKVKPKPELTPEQKVTANIEWVNKNYKPEIGLIKSWQNMAPDKALKAIKEYLKAMKEA